MGIYAILRTQSGLYTGRTLGSWLVTGKLLERFFICHCPISGHLVWGMLHLSELQELVGDLAIDNRAGISRTLHRITGIRNRKGVIIGLTCRVGRAISGSAVLLRDLVQDGGSLLLIGPPGVGKTTMIRMNYITMQLAIDLVVLIEAVENHMPQVIVIDETGTKLEALAASKIAQHGIQLVATAHGVTIENLIMSPSLEMLVGRIQSVTLGDEEANRRGVLKTVQERKAPAT
ncbi:protein SEEDLING PLASTID DEVELOPMENT 1-like [Pyrus x bretschneideri]|uniref:protein SEEDLING PLASTID DEVELOPMENT 1-like n=1 Tax=Pyrus x bretschneideri TaxID=225117 RepID=UPI00202FB724|nr:protein SEEDLING PLASTID DEVELOPMENT 1-like [Pyrus x bretschneideri]